MEKSLTSRANQELFWVWGGGGHCFCCLFYFPFKVFQAIHVRPYLNFWGFLVGQIVRRGVWKTNLS